MTDATQPFPGRDLRDIYSPRQDHEPHRHRVYHKPSGTEGFGEAATPEEARVMANADLEQKLRERGEGAWPRAVG